MNVLNNKLKINTIFIIFITINVKFGKIHCHNLTNPSQPHEATMLGSVGCHYTPIQTLG
jgi:hypothetical protein